MITAGAKNRLTKNLKWEKLNELTLRALKAPTYFWDLGGPKLSPLTDLENLHKQKVKAKIELQTAWLNLKMCSNITTGLLGKD